MPSERANDAELLAAARSDPDAFAAFYDRYELKLAGYFARRTGDPEVAADLTAEVFAAVLGAADRYRPQQPTAAAWLFTIAHNTLAKSLRRGRVEDEARRSVGIHQPVSFENEELEWLQSSAGGDGWALELLEQLPHDQREAIRARILQERSYPDIAGELKTSELVIRKRVSRGLSNLRAGMENHP
jgi:RNA polymerase sigma-70 factor (ECF subfamily)